jgi:hypothetical protein
MKLRDIEREQEAAQMTVDHFMRSLHDGSVQLEPHLKRIHISQLSANLEGTFVIRMFSEFELSLRLFLKEKHQRVPARIKPRMNRVANLVGFKGAALDDAHKARRYRNKVVHHLDVEIDQLTLRRVTSFLCTYLDKLQKDW